MLFILGLLVILDGCFRWWCWFFFFKQKTAYEMRISDWSSDVCSSDLRQPNQSIIRPMFWIGFEAVTAEAPGTGRECRPIGDHSGHGADPLGRAAGKSRGRGPDAGRSEEHTSELQSLMRISYAVFCLKKKKSN